MNSIRPFPFILAILFPLMLIAQSGDLNLMPVPAHLTMGEGLFNVTETFTAAVYGPRSQRVYRGTTRMLRRLAGRTGYFLTQDHIGARHNSSDAPLAISWNRVGEVKLGEDESYALTVTSGGIDLSAETDIGILRGLETILQLLEADGDGYHLPALTINDTPRFPWRGLLLDVCRHYLPVDVVKRTLDGMAAVKLNVFHWHLSEDQGFRVESKTFPKLHEMGSDGFYYTQDEIRGIIKYADDRGIRVVPEFDMPGHATSWLVGYPELASAPGPYTIDREWGIRDPALDPTKKSTYKFLNKFLKEMTALFPDPYFHIGGDEVNGKQWAANSDIQAFMQANDLADKHALQSYFNKRVMKMLGKYGKIMVGWDEILHSELPNNSVIQSWRGEETLVKGANGGYGNIRSHGYYVDLIQSTEYHYLNDPVPSDSALQPGAERNILGGEACSWGEFVSPEIVDSIIWPRLAAIAERFWSPKNVRDVDDMYRRLDVVSYHLEELGLEHLTYGPKLMRRLTNNQDTQALENFVAVVEQLKIYARHRPKKYYSYSPLTRVVDLSVADPKLVRQFRNLVSEYLAAVNNKNGPRQTDLAAEINGWLTLWRDNHAKLQPIIQSSPILWEIDSLSIGLSTAAAAGLSALEYIESGKQGSAAWLAEQTEIMAAAGKPRGQVEIMVLPAIDRLLQAAVGNSG